MSVTDERLWEFQTRLLENSVNIHREYRRNAPTVPFNGDECNTKNGTIPPTMTVKIGDSTPTINTTGSVSLLSETRLETTEDYKFANLPASIVMLLTPKVEMYKVFSEGTGSALQDRAYLLHQGKSTKADISRALSDGSITALDDNMQGVVVQAVEFTKLGGNPAEVHTNIKFNIRLYAKSITEFFTKTDAFPDTLVSDIDDFIEQEEFREASNIYSAASEAAAASLQAAQDAGAGGSGNLLERALDAQEQLESAEAALRTARREYVAETDLKQVAWIDIIKIDPGQELNADVDPSSPQPVVAPSGGSLQVEEKEVRMKVKIHYALSGGRPDDIGERAWSKWVAAVDEQKEVFFLSLLKHEWSFLGMQGVELSVDFVATGNAKTLQPSFDLFGGLDYERYRANKTAGFSPQRAERDRYSTIRNQLEGDIAYHRRRIVHWRQFNDGSSSDDARNARSLIEVNENKIEAAEGQIEVCVEKIEEFNEQETLLGTEMNEVKSKYKMRLFRQLYLNFGDGATSRNMKTRVFRATLASIYGTNHRIIFTPIRNERDFGRNITTTEVFRAGGSPIVDIPTTAEETGANDLSTKGDFVFLGDIIEAAYEAINLQSRTATGAEQQSDEVIFLEAEVVRTKRRYDATRYATLDVQLAALYPLNVAREALAAHLEALSTPFAFEGTSDFDEILARLDVVVAGKITYRHPVNPRSNWITINIADIPISLDLFRGWWLGKAREQSSYPLRDFIPDLMDYVTDMFKKIKYRSGAGSFPVEMKDSDLPKFILNNVLMDDRGASKLVNSGRSHIWATEERFLASLAASKQGTTGKTATVIEQSDMADMPRDDVPNIIFGQADRGILKQITFEREDIPGHAEARLMTDRGSVSSNIALREKYNVSIETRGTTSFLPGSVLYLDITPIELGYTSESNSYAKQLGLGGMYRVVSVHSSISLDGGGNTWTTKLKTKWESFGDGTNGDPAASTTRIFDDRGCE